MGYNVATGEYVDMYETGIIDPVKVTSSALKNASSVVSTLITTNHCIIQKVETIYLMRGIKYES